MLTAYWYDRRADPANLEYEIYKTFSYDSGLTWTPNLLVSDEPSPIPPLNPNFDPLIADCYMGDYNMADSDWENVYLVWSDNRRVQDGHADPDVYFEKEPLPETELVWLDDLEGIGNWSTSGLWHLQNDSDPCPNSYSPENSYGYHQDSDCTYDTGVRTSGDLTQNSAVTLPDWLANATLSFQSWEETESGGFPLPFDVRIVSATVDGGATWDTLWDTGDDSTAEGRWHHVDLDLTPHIGDDVQARFTFDSMDNWDNGHAGWYVDDVAIWGVESPSLLPEYLYAEGCPCEPQSHVLTLINDTGFDETFEFTTATSGPVEVLYIPPTVTLGFGEHEEIDMVVKIAAGTPPGATGLVTVTVTAQSDPTYSDTTVVEKVSGDYWERRADMFVPAMDNVVVEFEGYLGLNSWGLVQIYDPLHDVWFFGANEPTPPIEFPMDGCFGYDANGDPVAVLFPDATGTVTDTLHRYNIASNTWDTPTLPAPLPTGGLWAPDIAVDRDHNVCYISGGATSSLPGGGDLTSLYAYYPESNTATLLGDFTHIITGFNHHASWYVDWLGTDGSVCVGGGIDSTDMIYSDTQCYDIASGTFNPPNADLGPLPVPLWGMADAEKWHDGNQQLWLLGGADTVSIGDPATPATAFYSQADGAWLPGPPLREGVHRMEGATVGGDVYVEGGFTTLGLFDRQSYNQHHVQCGPCCGVWFWKESDPYSAIHGQTITYTLNVIHASGDDVPGLVLTDTLPISVTYAGHLTATSGIAWYDPISRTVHWQGDLPPSAAQGRLTRLYERAASPTRSAIRNSPFAIRHSPFAIRPPAPTSIPRRTLPPRAACSSTPTPRAIPRRTPTPTGLCSGGASTTAPTMTRTLPGLSMPWSTWARGAWSSLPTTSGGLPSPHWTRWTNT